MYDYLSCPKLRRQDVVRCFSLLRDLDFYIVY